MDTSKLTICKSIAETNERRRTAVKNFIAYLESDVGITKVDSMREVADGSAYITFNGSFLGITCSLADCAFVDAACKIFPDCFPDFFDAEVSFSRMQVPQQTFAKRKLRGEGFGKNVFRTNPDRGGYEASFDGKPSPDTLAALKANKFRWCNHGGYWYLKAERNERTDCFLKSLGLSKIPYTKGTNQ